MIVEVTPEIQMAIRIAAVKQQKTTGQIVEHAMRFSFPADIRDAEKAIAAAKVKGG
jgi:hypothetical protein